MYESPTAAVTKYLDLGGLKLQKLIVSQFWQRPEIRDGISLWVQMETQE